MYIIEITITFMTWARIPEYFKVRKQVRNLSKQGDAINEACSDFAVKHESYDPSADDELVPLCIESKVIQGPY